MRALQPGGRSPCPSLSPDHTADLRPEPRPPWLWGPDVERPSTQRQASHWHAALRAAFTQSPSTAGGLGWGGVQVTLVTVRPPDTRGLCEQRSHVFTGLSSDPVSATCQLGDLRPVTSLSVGSSVKWGDCRRVRCWEGPFTHIKGSGTQRAPTGRHLCHHSLAGPCTTPPPRTPHAPGTGTWSPRHRPGRRAAGRPLS